MSLLLDRLLSRLPRHTAREGRAEHPAEEDSARKRLDRLLGTLEAEIHSTAICELEADHSLCLDPAPRPLIHYVLKGCLSSRGSLHSNSSPTPSSSCRASALIASEQQVPAPPHRQKRELPTLADRMIKITSRAGRWPDVVITCGTIEASYGRSVGLYD